MLQNATDLDLTAFVGVGLGEGSWEAFCKNSIISRQIVETTAKDFAGTNPRHETAILEFAFYEYSGRVVYHLYLSKTIWADDEQNSGLVNFRLGMVVQISSICRKTAAKA